MIPEEILLVLDYFDYSKQTLAYIHSNLDQLACSELVKLYTHPRVGQDPVINAKVQEFLPGMDAYSLSYCLKKLRTDELSADLLRQYVLKTLR